MNIEILHCIEGAKKAHGITVVIDVFRAFSLECYLYAFGAKEIRPTGSLDDTYAWKQRDPSCILVGERGGKKCDGFDFGNSPSELTSIVSGKTVVHTTSAGTQGIVNAKNAEMIFTGSLVNAKATAEYILSLNPEDVCLAAMGDAGIYPAPEDELCALYIKSILLGNPLTDINERIKTLRTNGGEKFFNPDTQNIFPKEDFALCTDLDRFDFVLKVAKDSEGFFSKKIDI